MTSADIDGIEAPPEPDPAHQQYDATIAQAKMDLSIAERAKVLDAMTAEVIALRGRLEEAGWPMRFSDLELTSPGGEYKAQVTYVGGEFVAYITGLLGGRVRTEFRVTPDLYARQPLCIKTLAEILVLLGTGRQARLHLDPGGSPLGLEVDTGGDPMTANTVWLFGERAEDLERQDAVIDLDDEEEVDPAERAQTEMDEGPPDMSGSPGHDDR